MAISSKLPESACNTFSEFINDVLLNTFINFDNMKAHNLVLFLLLFLFLASCTKNTISKIPFITLTAFIPDTAMRVNVDTAAFIFSLIDADGDIGSNLSTDTSSSIYFRDSRFESAGFIRNSFPLVDISIEDPKKGLEGKCIFVPEPQPIPRPDPLHSTTGDTLYYQLYITDRAGHHSDTITTHTFIIRP